MQNVKEKIQNVEVAAVQFETARCFLEVKFYL